jgi:GTP-binding protein Era
MKSFRSGFVALIGEPNAGKSTLMNLLIGEKVSIVTPKPQTTRQRITGILTTEKSQLVFVDAPGMLRSTSGLNTFLKEEFTDVVRKADVILALLPSDATEGSAKHLIKLLRDGGKPFVAVVTKSDLLKGTATPRFFNLLLEEQIPFFSISALNRPEEAKEEVLKVVEPLLPDSGGPLFEDDLYTTQSMRDLAAEAIREACFLNLEKEIPYGLAIRIKSFKEDLKVPKIEAEILLERDSHKGIVIGAKASMLKKIGIESRKAIEEFVGKQVHLELHVLVRPNWFKNKRLMEELGYVIRD